jgi:thiazole synthase
MGADAVLVNTAIASAADPIAMAEAFRLGVEAGRLAREAGLARAEAGDGAPRASATSPLTAFLGEAAP